MTRRLRWPSVLGLETVGQALLVSRSANTLPDVQDRELQARVAKYGAAREAGTLVECKTVSALAGGEPSS